MTKQDFLERADRISFISANLFEAVFQQTGGFEEFKEIAQDVANHGANCGFGGWTWHNETEKFYEDNKDEILATLEEAADDFGFDSFVGMIKGFNVYQHTLVSTNEVIKALYTGVDTDTVRNSVSWFILEEAARAYCDIMEDEEEEG